MNIANLQATLRHFAAEREWQPFHTPKNLATALMVEAAELAEVFQWMTHKRYQRRSEFGAVNTISLFRSSRTTGSSLGT